MMLGPGLSCPEVAVNARLPGGGGGNSYLLLEDGSFLLLEDGSKLILE